MTLNVATLDSFNASRALLLEEARRLELAHACGGVLMLELAFEQTPLASRVAWNMEFGDARLEVTLRSPDGLEANVETVIDCLHIAQNPDQAPTTTAEAQMLEALRSFKLGSLKGQEDRVFKSFSFLTLEAANDLDTPFREAFQHLYDFAPTMLLAAARHFPATATPGDAESLAHQLGWPQVASMIQADRLRPSTGQPATHSRPPLSL